MVLGGVEIRTTAGPATALAVRVQRRPVRHRITGSAMPAGVTTAAIAKAGDMSDEDLVGAERVAVWAAAGWAGHPPTVRGLR